MADISLRVIDMSNKSDPVEVSHLDFEAANTAFSRYGVRVVGDYVYVAIGHYDEHSDNGLHIIDVSNPSNPFRIGKYCWEGGFYDLEVSDDFAYACTPDKRTLAGGSLCVIDISTPAKPLSVGRLEFNRDPVHISVKDNYAYITYDFGRKMSVIDISMPNSPTEVADWTYTSNQGDEDCITISSNYAYMGSVTGSLFIVDVGIPSEPTMLGEYRLADLLGSVTDVAVSGNYAYLAHRFGLSVIDISNPSMPTEAGSFTGMHKAGNCVAVAGGYCFLGGSSGLYVLKCLN
jgi:hypothetical protein